MPCNTRATLCVWAAGEARGYAARAVQFHPHGGQFDFVWLSARTMHPHGAYAWRARRNQEKYPPEKYYHSFIVSRVLLLDGTLVTAPIIDGGFLCAAEPVVCGGGRRVLEVGRARTPALQLGLSNLAAAPAAGTPWTMVWNDEFDAGSCPGGRPDPTKWGYEHGMVRNHEAQWYQPDNAACVDGKLVITAERVTPSKDKGNAQYTSASLLTLETAQWMYGRMEMRGMLTKKSGKCFRVGIFLDFVWLTTRTPHGAYVRRARRNRIDRHRGEIERLALQARSTSALARGRLVNERYIR